MTSNGEAKHQASFLERTCGTCVHMAKADRVRKCIRGASEPPRAGKLRPGSLKGAASVTQYIRGEAELKRWADGLKTVAEDRPGCERHLRLLGSGAFGQGGGRP